MASTSAARVLTSGDTAGSEATGPKSPGWADHREVSPGSQRPAQPQSPRHTRFSPDRGSLTCRTRAARATDQGVAQHSPLAGACYDSNRNMGWLLCGSTYTDLEDADVGWSGTVAEPPDGLTCCAVGGPPPSRRRRRARRARSVRGRARLRRFRPGRRCRTCSPGQPGLCARGRGAVSRGAACGLLGQGDYRAWLVPHLEPQLLGFAHREVDGAWARVHQSQPFVADRPAS